MKAAIAERMPYYLNKQEYFRDLPNDSCEIIFLGDSETQNFKLEECFRNLLVKNRGINGDETAGVLHRLDEVTESKPSKVFLQIGINDLIRGKSPETVVNNTRQIIRIIERDSPATQVCLQNLLPCSWNVGDTQNPVNDLVVAVNYELMKVAAQEGIPYIDLYKEFISNEGLRPEYDCGDALHLSGRGYMKWKEMVEPYVNDDQVPTKALMANIN
ncbi:MAG: sialate O-acetylesterase [Lewinellaceae bacterium]|nr:hypothetical protein [Saprospiraceae bacterium]MCB9338335.1 sialate O-acetylesterase [Lewinellaceae bacterium]